MKKYFVVSDVHSFYKELMESLNKKGFDINNDSHFLIVCGDLFDRGDETLKVYEFAKQLASMNRLIYIFGNHEQLLMDCFHSIKRGTIPQHHFNNGTVKTICDFTGVKLYDILCGCYDRYEFEKKANELIDFVAENTVDVAELDEYIFVHGWVPITYDENGKLIVHNNWEDGDWEEATWLNGMEMWNKGLTIANRTIVCGHFHTSWGWSNIRNQCSEFDDDAIFEPFIDVGIIAMDGCTAFTRNVNCIVIETE